MEINFDFVNIRKCKVMHVGYNNNYKMGSDILEALWQKKKIWLLKPSNQPKMSNQN